MKKKLALVCLALATALSAGTAMAESIKGRVGVTGRLGFNIPHDSDFNLRRLDTDVGFIGGGGLIYGIDNHLAAEIDVTHTSFDASQVDGTDQGSFDVTDISLGVQYRFTAPQPKLVPYVGAGIDFLINDHNHPNFTRTDVDTVVGVHLSGGVDYFVTKQIAINAELKGVLAPEADIQSFSTLGGINQTGNFDPSTISGPFGVRVFFN